MTDIDFDSLSRAELTALLQEVFAANERRRDLDEIPGKIAGLLARYASVGGDLDALDPLVRPILHDELHPPVPEESQEPAEEPVEPEVDPEPPEDPAEPSEDAGDPEPSDESLGLGVGPDDLDVDPA